MQGWQTTYLGMCELPRDISGFELQAFFTFCHAERELIGARRGESLKLGLALHIGFLRMSGRVLDAFRIVPPALWRHLGSELGIDAPEISSLRALYGRGRTLFDHQQVACEALGFRWMTEHQRRALVRLMSDEVARCADREQLLVFARRWLYGMKGRSRRSSPAGIGGPPELAAVYNVGHSEPPQQWLLTRRSDKRPGWSWAAA